MNTPTSQLSRAAWISAVALLVLSDQAVALNLKTVVAPIYQIGTGATVQLGHTVLASTNYNRLNAGGTYSAACNAPETMPTTGQRSLSAETLWGGTTLTVTIPEWHPARVNMPGFESVPRGGRINCTYNWTSRANEGGFTIGVGGISFQSGNGEQTQGGTQLFVMDVPKLSDPNENSPCIP
jgi:hypothetical protein